MKQHFIYALLGILISGSLYAQNDGEIQYTREYIHQLEKAGQFDKHAYDLQMEAVHQENLDDFGGEERDGCDCYEESNSEYTTILPAQFSPNSLDGSFGPIPLPFDFCFFGDTKTQAWINTKGTITFDGPNTTFVPSGFPDDGFQMIAGFWADIDINGGGTISYKATETAIFINFTQVGYYFQHSDKRNSFQIVITDGTDESIGVGNNVGLCFDEMEWASGDWNGGQGGFGGTAASTVGANRGDGSDYFQIGRFITDSYNYDGPFGSNDGVHWLDYQSLVFDACFSSDNIPPIPAVEGACDIIYVCQGDVVDISASFFAPEEDQSVTIVVDDSDAPGFELINVIEGDFAYANGTITGNADNIGTHILTFIGTDDGDPVESTTVSYTIEVLDISSPPLEIDGVLEFCGGASTVLTASDGFDSYSWSTGCDTQECEVSSGGIISLEANFFSCTSSAEVEVVETPYFLPCISPYEEPICSNEFTPVSVCNDQYVTYSWDEYLDYPGQIDPGSDSSSTGVNVSAGTFVLQVTTEAGCIGQYIFAVDATDAVIPEDTWSGAYCDNLQEQEFCCGFATAELGTFWLYMFNNDGNWAGDNASLTVLVNGDTLLTNVQSPNPDFTLWTPNFFTQFGDYIEIYYDPGNSTGTETLQILNCSSNFGDLEPVELTGPGLVWEGFSDCPAEPAVGMWEIVDGPPGGDFSIEDDFNTTFTPGDYGIYNLHFLSLTCGIDYYYEVEYNQPPSIDLDESDLTLCDGDSFDLIPNIIDIVGNAEFQWVLNGTDSISNDLELSVNSDGNYVVNISNACGSDFDSVTVIAQDTPIAELEDETICDGETITLDPGPDCNGCVYTWSTNQNTPEIDVNQSNLYTVTVVNECGSATASAQIDFFAELNIPLDDELECNGNPVTLSVPDGLGTVVWSNGDTGTSTTVTEGGTYTVTITNDCLTDSEDAVVVFATEPSVSIGLDTLRICAGTTELIEPISYNGTIDSYTWLIDDEFFSDDDRPNMVSEDIPAEFLVTGVPVYVTVAGPCGSDEDFFIAETQNCNVWTYNVMTPNGDGMNDFFEIGGIYAFSGVIVKIFDRWGNLVYESPDYQNNWDGEGVSEGTYYYTAVIPNGEDLSGSFTLIR